MVLAATLGLTGCGERSRKESPAPSQPSSSQGQTEGRAPASAPRDPGERLVASAMGLSARGRYADALPVFEEALRYRPNDARLHFYLGNAALHDDRYERAVAAYRRATELDPGFAAAYHNLGGLYGILLGYLVTKKQFVGRRSMELVSMVNYALPGTIVGIAYLIAFNDPPIELTGTALIIVACYVFRYGPTGIRATVALLSQIDKSLEEASQGLGAGSGTTFRRITLPLILPAFFAGLGVVFIRSMTAISATIFLVSVSWTLITVKILENITELSLGPAAAFSVLVCVIVFVVIAVIGRLLRVFRAPGAPSVTSMLGG